MLGITTLPPCNENVFSSALTGPANVSPFFAGQHQIDRHHNSRPLQLAPFNRHHTLPVEQGRMPGFVMFAQPIKAAPPHEWRHYLQSREYFL